MTFGEIVKGTGGIEVFDKNEKYIEKNGFVYLFDFYHGNGGPGKRFSVLATTDFSYQAWTKPPDSVHFDGDRNFVLSDDNFDLATLGFFIRKNEAAAEMSQLQRVTAKCVPDVKERLAEMDYRQFLTELWIECCSKSGVKELRILPAQRFVNFPPLKPRHETYRSLYDEELPGYYAAWRKSQEPGVSDEQIGKELRRIFSQRKGWRKNYDENAARFGFQLKEGKCGVEYFCLKI